MDFIDLMAKEETVLTENGALGYRTTGKKLLDLNFAAGSFRDADEAKIIKYFTAALAEDQTLALRWLFFARDIRNGGMGERRLFRTCLAYVVNDFDIDFDFLYDMVEKYGRLDDFVELLNACPFNPSAEEKVAEVISKNLAYDITNYYAKKPISLLAKWLPSINTSSAATRAKAKKLVKYWGITEAEYRKLLSGLRSYTNVVEAKISRGAWNEVDYEKVPSYANLKYSSAFLKHDKERREAYLEALEKGEAKINAGTLYPYDIVHKYEVLGGWYGWSRNHYEVKPELEALWNNLPKYNINNTLIVADGSGSMLTTVGRTKVTALEVCYSLAIYYATHTEGDFANKFITFSSHPEFVELDGKTLYDHLLVAREHDDCSNTNIYKTFKLILDTAIKNKLTQEEIPDNILILSDMEFDAIRADKVLFERIKEEFDEAGYFMPRLIFWNLCSRTNAIPLCENELGIALVSGFSPAIADMVMSGELDPYKVLVDKLENYKEVDKIIK